MIVEFPHGTAVGRVRRADHEDVIVSVAAVRKAANLASGMIRESPLLRGREPPGF